MDLGLKDKVVLITGAGQGVGRTLGTAFAKEGAQVAFHYGTSALGAERAVQECLAAGADAMAVQADLRESAQIESLVAQVKARFGPVEVLVNNAAITRQERFLDSRPEDWAPQFAVTVEGLMHLVHTVLPDMVERQQGSIVTVTGESGRVGEAKLAVTAAARAATIAFSKSLAKELGRHQVRVNVVSLGLIHTLGLERERPIDPDTMKKMVRLYPLGRLGQAEDVVPVVLLLASPRSAWVTGQVYAVNGGYTMV